MTDAGFTCRRNSTLWKKKSRSREGVSGPPTVPPNWLNRKGARSRPLAFANQLLAWSLSFRRNSYSTPWNSLPPERVTMFTTAPAVRPYSAENALVWTLNSWSVSGDGMYEGWL